ncbi:P-loop containing NTP hydrolase pore-1-domain-containing protein, partial [Tribonema minus]
MPESPGPPPAADQHEDAADLEEDIDDVSFCDYKPVKLAYGRPHPDATVESATMAAVMPPDIWYTPALLSLEGPADVIGSGKLSGLQLESVVYAAQRHETYLPDGVSRGGFFLGDGAGVGKGRQLAAMILENTLRGRNKHIWISVGADLALDARRDLDDIGAGPRRRRLVGPPRTRGAYIPSYPLQKAPYGNLRFGHGVMFLTYSTLVAKRPGGARGRATSRLEQLIAWAGGAAFDGCLLLDECHRAKNFYSGAGNGPSSQSGRAVVELQARLPNARVVYCSATGASEPRNLGYMTRLGLWGQGTPFPSGFEQLLGTVDGHGVGAMEMMAMHLKQSGAFLCRTLSFAGCGFELPMCDDVTPGALAVYDRAAALWQRLRREVAASLDERGRLLRLPNPAGPGLPDLIRRTESAQRVWRYFWGAHQRFFRDLCIASKVPAAIAIARAALDAGQACVIGLQSTGEAGTLAALAEAQSETLPDTFSAPHHTLRRVVKKCLPLP